MKQRGKLVGTAFTSNSDAPDYDIELVSELINEPQDTDLDALAEKIYLATLVRGDQEFISPKYAYKAAQDFLNYKKSRVE